MTTLRTRAAALLAAALTIASCSGSSGPDPETTAPTTGGGELVVAVASYETLAGEPNRLLAGLQHQVAPEEYELVSFGQVEFSFAYLGTEAEPIQGGEPYGEPATADFLPVPNEDGSPPAVTSDTPVLTLPSEARGVYAAHDVVFDRAGFYELTVTAEVDGAGTLVGSGAFQVVDEPAYPAPGQDAPRSENLTVDSADAPMEAVDSRAQDGAPVPDPELHQVTVADAIAEGRPVLVVVSTPVFCVSRFCGPITDVVQGLVPDYRDRVAFVHLEVWRDYENQVVNQGAADWVYRGGNLTEPWVFLVGPDGTVVARWDNVATEDELRAALDALPSG